MSEQSQNPFKWSHFQSDIILLCVRWYLRYALISRDPEEIMLQRGLQVDQTTISRWVQRYGLCCKNGLDPILGFFRTFRAHQYVEGVSNALRKRIRELLFSERPRSEENRSPSASNRHFKPTA